MKDNCCCLDKYQWPKILFSLKIANKILRNFKKFNLQKKKKQIISKTSSSFWLVNRQIWLMKKKKNSLNNYPTDSWWQL